VLAGNCIPKRDQFHDRTPIFRSIASVLMYQCAHFCAQLDNFVSVPRFDQRMAEDIRKF
jgi:hypothetical protein